MEPQGPGSLLVTGQSDKLGSVSVTERPHREAGQWLPSVAENITASQMRLSPPVVSSVLGALCSSNPWDPQLHSRGHWREA